MNETTPTARGPEAEDAAVRRLRNLLDLSIALATVPDLATLLNRILRGTTTALDCEAASILLYDERVDALRFSAATGSAASALADIQVPLNGSLAGTIFREDRALLAEDLERDARHFDQAAEDTTLTPRVLLGVPMRLDGTPVGVLEALNPHGDTFDAVDVEVLEAIAAQASVAVQNARRTEALRTANSRLAELDQLKTNFMSIASHEMRTPITAVQGFSQFLIEEVPDDLKDPVDAIVRAGKRLMNVVSTIDEMAALDHDDQMPFAPVDLRQVLSDVVATAPGSIELAMADGPLIVHGDARRLHLAFANLIQNAHQFSRSDDAVSVEAQVTEAAVRVRVQDAGRGLAAEDLERIFEAFHQVADPDTRDHEGLGVGLTVARSVMLKHGGRLWAESDGVGQGSVFTARLPLAESA
ncbi:MAG: hypothetical protein Rubg2KO_18460 [Rubricoccaceae bacterium]